MATSPTFAATPRVGVGQVTTADTSYTAPTGVAVFTAGGSGSRIDRIDVQGAQAVIAAGLVRLFFYDGSTYRLFREVPVTAVTGSATAIAFAATVTFPNGIILPGSGFNQIRATTSVTQNLNVIVHGGDF